MMLADFTLLVPVRDRHYNLINICNYYKDLNCVKLIVDSSKSKKQLGWKTCLSFDEMVSETVSWYKKYTNDKNDIKNFTKKQIENYITKAKENNLQWAT